MQAPSAATTDSSPEAVLASVVEGRTDLTAVARAAAACRACDLWARATQTVFGQGPVPARWMLVGEQPGDHEDLEGAPFVGPAGRILDEALEAAGIDRESVFITNVVKHFKWRPTPGSKRRLHETPNRAETGACLPWVESELALVKPEVLVLLGATAARALVGEDVRVTRDHGREAREAALAGMVADLRVAARRAA